MRGLTLLTGATGFLGGTFYLDAFKSGRAHEFLLLVRGADEAACRLRLAKNFVRVMDRQSAIAASEACGILPGDLMSLATSRDPRLDDVTHIVHTAAETSFDSRASVWEINVDGTLVLASRARRMKRLSRFLHIGTAFCCGETPHLQMVGEAVAPGPGTPHIAEYTRSKAAAEHALKAAFPELPVVVARPSIIVGDTQLGVRASGSILWFFRVLDLTGVIPAEDDGFIDVVPVDWVSARLHDLLHKPDLKHDLYHVSAGEGSRTSWTEFQAAFAQAGHPGQRPYQRFDFKGPDGWQIFDAAYKAAFPTRDAVHRTMAVGSRKYHRFLHQDIAFDNARLLAEGLPPPPAFKTYLDVCLRQPGTTVIEQFLDDAPAFEFDEELMTPSAET